MDAKMAANGESSSLYTVLGLRKECTEMELRSAYKKLAMKWHPDRCAPSATSKAVENSKQKFQAIQEAYSVLSDGNKRLMYDVGVYDDEVDANYDMDDFLGEMATMMNQAELNGKDAPASFEDLQNMFDEMFERDCKDFEPSSINPFDEMFQRECKGFEPSSLNAFDEMFQRDCKGFGASTFINKEDDQNPNNKRNCHDMNPGKIQINGVFDFHNLVTEQNFCFGAQDEKSTRNSPCHRRNGRKSRTSSSRRGVSS